MYGVIVPAEIRDYFRDKAMNVETMTVQLGLVKASLFSIALLSVGGTLCGTGFLLRLASGSYPAALDRIRKRYKNIYAWVLANAKPLPRPLIYVHRKGAVIWVKIPDIPP